MRRIEEKRFGSSVRSKIRKKKKKPRNSRLFIVYLSDRFVGKQELR